MSTEFEIDIPEIIKEVISLSGGGRFDQAGTLLEQGIDIAGDEPRLLRALARVRARQGRQTEVVGLLERAVQAYSPPASQARPPDENVITASQHADIVANTFAIEVETEILRRRMAVGLEPHSGRAGQQGIDVESLALRFRSSQSSSESEGSPLQSDLTLEEFYEVSRLDVDNESQADARSSTTIDDPTEWLVDELRDASVERTVEGISDDLSDEFLEEFADELPTREELGGLSTKITVGQKARQLAADLCLRYELPRSNLPQLAEILSRRFYGPTYKVLVRELANGASTAELSLAHRVRDYWSSQRHFALLPAWNGELQCRYSLFPWPAALALVRSFGGLPDLEEIETYINEAYDRWASSNTLMAAFQSFYYYVRSSIDERSSRSMDFDWSSGDDLDTDIDNDEWRAVMDECEQQGLKFYGDGEIARLDTYRRVSYVQKRLRVAATQGDIGASELGLSIEDDGLELDSN